MANEVDTIVIKARSDDTAKHSVSGCSVTLSLFGVPIAVLDEKTAILECNEEFSALFQQRLSPNRLQEGVTLDAVLPELAAKLHSFALIGGDDERVMGIREIELPGKTGSHIYLAHFYRLPKHGKLDGAAWSLMLADISHIRRNEKSKRRNHEIEMLLSRISNQMVGIEDPMPAIQTALADIGQFLDATEVHLILLKPDTTIVEQILHWRNDGMPSICLAMCGNPIPMWWREQLTNEDSVLVRDLRELPPTAQREIRKLGGQGHGAIQLKPLVTSQQLTGVVGVFHEQPREQDAAADVVVLELFNHIIERVIQLYRKDLALKKSTAELREKQVQLVRSEKMAVIGQLAAGVAHEINNPVGFVMSNLGTLQGYAEHFKTLLDIGRNVDPEMAGLSPELKEKIVGLDQSELTFIAEDLDDLLAESLGGCVRVRDIVQNLKSFARVDDTGHVPADLHECVESTLKIVWNELKYRCEIVKQYGEVPQITCRIGEINQVIMNLLVNAAHAIGEHGTITITTRQEEQTAVLEIADTGCGIAPEHLTRVFDPFFTTKSAGKGTGLGLNISQKIVEQHSGTITVASTPGEGTTFIVRLPLAEAEAVPNEEDIIG